MPSSKMLSSIASSVTVLAVILLALMHVLGFATAELNTLTLSAIVIAGTVAWLIQAKQPCPGCSRLYGYRFRFMHARICRHCGAEFDL
ncbi:MAG: hypothetical protein ACRBM6_00355 [Geminicoccales bacterium]